MPRFYFHLHNGTGLTSDEEGQELADLDAARDCAIVNIRSLLSGEVGEGVIDLQGRIEIADEGGTVLAVVPFREAVELRLGSDTA